MKRILFMAVVVSFFAGVLATNGFALLDIPENMEGGGGGGTLSPTAPVIESIRSYEFKKTTGPNDEEYIAITAKDFDGDDLTLTVNASSFASTAHVLPPVNSPGFASVVVVISTRYATVGDHVLLAAVSDGDPHNTQTAEIPVRIIPENQTPNQGIRLNDTLSTYIRVHEGQHQEHSIVLEGLQYGEKGSILVSGQSLPGIRYTEDGNDYSPHGRLIINNPGPDGTMFELTVHATEQSPGTHFAETKVVVEVVP